MKRKHKVIYYILGSIAFIFLMLLIGASENAAGVILFALIVIGIWRISHWNKINKENDK